jgi:hypothetical protein
MATTTTNISKSLGQKLAQMASRGGLSQAGRLLRALNDQSDAQTQITVGSYTGGGSLQTLSPGFNPTRFEARTLAGTRTVFWQYPMSNGRAIVDATLVGVPVTTIIVASNGVTPGSSTPAIYLGSAANMTGKLYLYEAERSGPTPTT